MNIHEAVTIPPSEIKGEIVEWFSRPNSPKAYGYASCRAFGTSDFLVFVHTSNVVSGAPTLGSQIVCALGKKRTPADKAPSGLNVRVITEVL